MGDILNLQLQPYHVQIKEMQKCFTVWVPPDTHTLTQYACIIKACQGQS